MAENKVSAKIAADARSRVKEIEKQFLERQRQLEKQAREFENTFSKETKNLLKAQEERIRREILSEARLASRRRILTAKHSLIEASLKKAADKFIKSQTYAALLARIAREHGKGAEVLLSPADRKRFAKQAWAKNAKEAPINGGIILRGSKRDINFSIDAAFESLGEQLSLELAEILETDNKPPPKKRSTKKN